MSSPVPNNPSTKPPAISSDVSDQTAQVQHPNFDTSSASTLSHAYCRNDLKTKPSLHLIKAGKPRGKKSSDQEEESGNGGVV